MATVQINETLIIDVGVSEGNDSNFYLRKGFSVVGVEADPGIVADLKKRFDREIASGQFSLLPFAAAATAGETLNFWHDDLQQGQSSLLEREHGRVTEHRVQTIDWPQLREVAGVPYYMKIDIEGAEDGFLSSMSSGYLLPTFISSELQSFRPVEHFYRLGYRRFRLINQLLWPNLSAPQPPLEGQFIVPESFHHWSGFFGRELPGDRWYDFEEIQEIHRSIHRLWEHGTLIVGWMDCHATW